MHRDLALEGWRRARRRRYRTRIAGLTGRATRRLRLEPLEARTLLAFSYVLADLGTYDGPEDVANWGLNDLGQVIGFHRALAGTPTEPTGGGGELWVDHFKNGFFDEDGRRDEGATDGDSERLEIVPADGQPAWRLMDLNDAGQITGVAYDALGVPHAAVWDSSGTLLDTGPQAVGALTINRHGVVVDPLARRMWEPGGAPAGIELADVFEIDTGGTDSLNTVLDFNDRGELLVTASGGGGSHFYVWTPGSAPLTTGVNASIGGALNNHGQVALSVITGGLDFDTLVWDRESNEVVSLGALMTQTDINDHGQVIGNTTSGGSAPMVWDRETGLQNVNDLVVQAGDFAVTQVLKLNNFGQILGLAENQGQEHVVLLSPQLGLDRWWAEAGTTEPLELTWTVRVGEKGVSIDTPTAYSVAMEVPFGSPWGSTPGATLTVVSNGFDSHQSHDLSQTVSLQGQVARAAVGELLPGTYQFLFDGLAVPAQPAISPARFDVTHNQFGIPLAAGIALEARLVADHADNFQNAAYNVLLPGGDEPILYSDATALIDAFKPVFHHHASDFLGPWPVDLTWGQPDEPLDGNPAWVSGPPTRGSSTQTLDLSRFGPDPLPYARAGTFTPLPPATATVYAAIVARGSNELAINYYFHYPRSNWSDYGGVNTHEGDWEGITVYFARDGVDAPWSPVDVAYAQHERVAGALGSLIDIGDGGDRAAWQNLAIVDGTRPPVFVGQGGHASYPVAGVSYWPLPESHLGGFVQSDVTTVYLPRLGAIDPDGADDHTWDWLVYPGRWGRKDIGGLLAVGDDGPPGPVFLAGGFAPGTRWLDPWTWAAGFNEVLAPGTIQWLFDSANDLFDWSPVGDVEHADDGSGTNGVAQLTEGSDAAIGQFLNLPQDVSELRLEYQFTQPGDGDALVVLIDGQPQRTIVGSSFTAAMPIPIEPIDLRPWADQHIHLQIRLETTGAPNSQVWIDNVAILRGPPLEPIRADLISRNAANEWWLGRSDGTAFLQQPLFNWHPTTSFDTVLAGDFDGDGGVDLAGRAPEGTWVVSRVVGSDRITEHWGAWPTDTQWHDVMVADFNGDGLDDLIGRNDEGEWWVALSTGEGFVNELWGNWSPTAGWQDVHVADLDGDGRWDLIGRTATDEWWAARSLGFRFDIGFWTAWRPAGWRDVQVADYDGDGRHDLIGRTQTGEWWVSRSLPTGPRAEFVGRWLESAQWRDVMAADMDGDGRIDLVGRTATGEWWIGRSTPGGLLNAFWGRWVEAADWHEVRVADVNGDGRADIVGRTQGEEWWVALSTGSGLVNEFWGRRSSVVQWRDTHLARASDRFGLRDLNLPQPGPLNESWGGSFRGAVIQDAQDGKPIKSYYVFEDGRVMLLDDLSPAAIDELMAQSAE